MSTGKEIINVSSDSSDSELSFPSGTVITYPPFPPYLPPYRPPKFGRRTKEQARKFKHDINAKYLPFHRDYQSPHPSHPPQAPQPTSELAKELPHALTQALGKALSSLKKIPVPPPQSQPSQSTAPSGSHGVLMGLVCPKVWEMAS